MGSFLPQSLIDFPNFSSVFFYPLSLSNELQKYPAFIENHSIKHHSDDDEASIEHKHEVFKMKGNLNYKMCFDAFYSQKLFKKKNQQ